MRGPAGWQRWQCERGSGSTSFRSVWECEVEGKELRRTGEMKSGGNDSRLHSLGGLCDVRFALDSLLDSCCPSNRAPTPRRRRSLDPSLNLPLVRSHAIATDLRRSSNSPSTSRHRVRPTELITSLPQPLATPHTHPLLLRPPLLNAHNGLRRRRLLRPTRDRLNSYVGGDQEGV